MELYVVVVAYGSPALLDDALEPLRGRPVIVVDNSSDAAVRGVVGAHGARYVDPGRNLGFGSAVNCGIRQAWADVGECDVVLLNPDAVVTSDALDRLHLALHERPRTSAVAPVLVGETQQRSAWPWPSPRAMWREALRLDSSARDRQDWLVGAVLLINGAAYAAVGPFDERFFLYAEETDWQRRATAAGWGVRLVPEVQAGHVGAATSTDSRRREVLFHAGTETYIRKWFGPHGWWSYRLAAITGAAVRALLPSSAGTAARRRLGIYLRGPRNAAGFSA